MPLARTRSWSQWLTRSGTPSRRNHLDSSRNGDCALSQRAIRIEVTNEPAQQVKTLAHELAHAILHESFDGSRDLAELDAESVEYIVCSDMGLDSSAYSFGYVASWAGGGGEEAIKGIQASGQRIATAAHLIIDHAESTADAPVEFVRHDPDGRPFYVGPNPVDGYRRLCQSHHNRYDFEFAGSRRLGAPPAPDRFVLLVDRGVRLVDAELEHDQGLFGPRSSDYVEGLGQEARIGEGRRRAANGELSTLTVVVVDHRVQRVPGITLEIGRLRRCRIHPDEQPPDRDPGRDWVHSGGSVRPHRRQEGHVSVDALATERRDRLVRAFQVRPRRHREAYPTLSVRVIEQ